MTPTLWFWTAIGSVLLGGVFSSLFYALSDLSRPALETISSRTNRPWKDRHLRAILSDLSGHAHAVGLLRIVCNAMSAVAFTLAVAGLRRPDLGPAWVDIAFGVPLSALVVWTFGLVIPSSVARHAGEHAVYSLAVMLRVIYTLTKPLQSVVRFFDEIVRRLSGGSDDHGEELKDEVLSAVEEGRQEGQFDESERDMIQAVVRFRDTTVAQIMTPRTEMEAMELANDLGTVTATIRKQAHSRVPVYDGTIDRVVGIFYVKDLMRWLAGEGSRGGKTFNLRQILRPAIFVPETKTVRELLQELLEKRVHIAIVADEYGGTAGLVTIEDIVELVFGDIQDEYEVPQAEPDDVSLDHGKGEATVDARAYIADVNAELKSVGLELPESEDYDTVGGFVTVTLGRIPTKGETIPLAFEHGPSATVTILEAEPTRVKRVRFARLAHPTNAAAVAGQSS